MSLTPNNNSSIPASHYEQILVVQRAALFTQYDAWQGLYNQHIDDILQLITTNQEYIPRYAAETDPTYKQIIPYLIFTYQNTYFVMQRRSTASEQRLANKLSLGIGGHMHEQDIQGKTIFDWAQREFEEEVSYQGNLKITTLGILNDDSNDVGKVHLGLVILLQGDNDQISIKDEHKSGQLLSLPACLDQFDAFENWSQIVLQTLKI